MTQQSIGQQPQSQELGGHEQPEGSTKAAAVMRAVRTATAVAAVAAAVTTSAAIISANIHMTIAAAVCILTAVAGASLIVIEILLLDRGQAFMLGYLAGWIRGWRGLPPEVDG